MPGVLPPCDSDRTVSVRLPDDDDLADQIRGRTNVNCYRHQLRSTVAGRREEQGVREVLVRVCCDEMVEQIDQALRAYHGDLPRADIEAALQRADAILRPRDTASESLEDFSARLAAQDKRARATTST